MFNKLRTPVLGLVENMSGFECRHCGHREEIFGRGGARRFAMANEIPFLGEIPLSTEIRTTSDEGYPIVQAMPESPGARAFLRVAENLAAQVSTLTLGGVLSDRPEIAEITRPSTSDVRILWKDGHESLYTGYALRVGCRCAVCVDEMSGNKRLREESISKDVRPLSIDPVGRYAIRFQWRRALDRHLHVRASARAVPLPDLRRKKRRTNTIEALGTEDASSGFPRRRGRVLPNGDPASRPCGTLQKPGNIASGGLRVGRERSLFAFSSWKRSSPQIRRRSGRRAREGSRRARGRPPDGGRRRSCARVRAPTPRRSLPAEAPPGAI